MSRVVQAPPESRTPKAPPYGQSTKFKSSRKWLLVAFIVLAAVILAAITLLAPNWPFSRSKVIADLQDAMQGRVEVGKFSQTFFPHPGCVAEDVTFTAYGNLTNPIPITVHKLTIQGSYHGLLTKHIPVLRAEGVHVTAPNANYFSGWKQNSNNSKAVIDEFIITGSVIEFSRGKGPSLKFEITELALPAPDAHGVMQFTTTLRNPEPLGDVKASGYFGPWRSDSPAQTPIWGSYSFTQADLGVFQGIAGILSSQGSFQGTVGQLSVSGKSTTPDFEIKDAGHKISLATQFQATISSRGGDVSLGKVTARLGKSSVESSGKIAQMENTKGKLTSLELLVRNGRIQDFLLLLLNNRTPPMTGAFNFKGRATLPPDERPFIEKIQLEGDFGVDAVQVSNPATQANLEQLSERAEGDKAEDPERILSDLEGHFVLSQGTATFSDLRFKIPGAVARMQGTYSLVTRHIDLHGTIFTKANLSQETSGVKSFLLKVIDPFLKKNRRGGAVIPISITGVYPNAVYKTDPI